MEIYELKVTCSAHPAQLEGVTDTGLFVYARARHDRVFVGLFKDGNITNPLVCISGTFNSKLSGCSTSNVEKLTKLTEAFIAMVE